MKKISILFILAFAVLQTASPCTSVIVSGKITKDGRPLLVKNRDTPRTDNAAHLFQGERYKYIGITAAIDRTPVDVWGGHNETGFAIINTAAFNLNGCDGEDSNKDGELMKRALEICRTIDDFQHLLDTLPKPMDLNSNFGVIDALGNCAYFETNNEGYIKFDVNDPSVAPDGYLIRTNYGTTGCRSIDRGVERFMAAEDFMLAAQQGDNINCRHLLTQLPRNLKHGLTKQNLFDIMPQSYDERCMVPFRDFVTRWTSSAIILVQGVASGESAQHTISWTNIGWPPASVAIPLLITPSSAWPQIVGGSDGASWLCRQSLEEKQKVFNAGRGYVEDYIDLSKLINKQKTGIMQRVMKIEQQVLDEGENVLKKVRKGTDIDKALDSYYQWVDNYVKKQFQQ